MLEKRQREIEKDGVVAGDRHLGAGVLELGGGGQRSAVGRRGVKPFNEAAAGGDQMEVAVDGVIRAEAAVGSGEIGNVVACDGNGFELRAGVRGDGLATL